MGLGIPSRPTYVVSHKVTNSSIPQAIISPSKTCRPTMPPSKQPPKNMAPFTARLDPSSKAALKVLLLGQELIDVNRTEGLALLKSSSDILSRRHGKPLQRGLSLAERMGETSERERGGPSKPVLEKKPEASTSSSVADFDTETRSNTSSAMTDPSELLSSGSDEDVQSFVGKLRDSLASLPSRKRWYLMRLTSKTASDNMPRNARRSGWLHSMSSIVGILIFVGEIFGRESGQIVRTGPRKASSGNRIAIDAGEAG